MKVLLSLSFLFIGLMAGAFLRPAFESWRSHPPAAPSAAERSGLINPLLACAPDDSFKPLRHSEIKTMTENLVARAVASGRTETVGVYYRDLNNGPVFGVNEDLQFVPASLLKVPVLIAYFKRMEAEPDLFSREIVYDPAKHVTVQVNQLIQPPTSLEPGRPYLVDFLLARMITQSDNTSFG